MLSTKANAFGPPLLLAAALTLTGCSNEQPHAPSTPAVKVAVPLQREVIEYADFTGRTDAVETVDVRAMVGGYLVRVSFQPGAVVGEGDLLYEVDPRTYQADYDQATAQVRLVEAQAKYAAAELARERFLYGKGSGSAEDLDKAQRSFDAASEAINKASADAARKKLDLDFTRVTAPISGRISRTQFTVGNLIQGGSVGATVLTTIVAVNPIYAYFDVDERTVLQVQDLIRTGKLTYARGAQLETGYLAVGTMGMLGSQLYAPLLGAASLFPGKRYSFYPVSIGLPTEKGTPHDGYIDFVNNRLDPSTGTLRVRGIFDNDKGLFEAGLFVHVRVPVTDKHPVLLISDRAVGVQQDQKFVYVIDANGKAAYRAVKLGGMHEGLRIVEEGLKEGDQVVVSGVQRLRPGVPVTARTIAMTADPDQEEPDADDAGHAH
jgi:RND family efflux transporter MFP subunit